MDSQPPPGAPVVDRRPRFYGMIWGLAGIAILLVSLRMYIRLFVRKAIGWDDYMICLALISHLIECASLTIALHYGVMLHMSEIPLLELLLVVRWFTVTEIVAIATPVLVKLSVCISILRMVTIAQRTVTRTIWILITVLVTTGLGTFIAFLLQCIPLQKVWKPWLDGKCMDRTTTLVDLYYFYGSVCTITDFLCGIIPIWVMCHLQMDRTTKFAVSFLLGLVLLPGICSIFKTIHVAETLNPDVTWAISGETMWVILEVSLGIIIASLPMLYGTSVTVYKRLSDRIRTWSSGKKPLVPSDPESQELKDMSGSDESSRAKSPVPLLGEFRQPAYFPRRAPSPVHDTGQDEELVLLKSENRLMWRREAVEYLAEKRAARDLESGMRRQRTL